MKKVLSTKLEVDKIDRFTTMAEQRNQSKAEYLRNLVQDHIDRAGKVDGREFVGRPQPTVTDREGPQLNKTDLSTGISRCINSLSDEGLHSKKPIYLHHQYRIGSASKASVTSSLSNPTKARHSLDLFPSSKESLSVYHDDFKGRPEVSAKSTTVKGLLLFILLFSLWLKYGPSSAVGRKYAFTIQD